MSCDVHSRASCSPDAPPNFLLSPSQTSSPRTFPVEDLRQEIRAGLVVRVVVLGCLVRVVQSLCARLAPGDSASPQGRMDGRNERVVFPIRS